ncbi:MAG: hypothetical protein HZB67_02020 [Candidatus Aenigmarchaeota archaeon]|nr:hypothetical protein [Candidatus Aenigmarchaeota archaeon]
MKLTNSILDDVVKFYNENHTLKDTCKMLAEKYEIKINYRTLRKIFIKNNVKLKTRSDLNKITLKKRLSSEVVEKIKKMYIKNQYSLKKITRLTKIHRRIVTRTLREAGVKILDKETKMRMVNTKHTKNPFSGDANEKAYIAGLALGDLSVMQKSKYTLRISVSTTHKSFIELLRSVFSKYGPVHVSAVKNKLTKYQWSVNIDVDSKSFDFLLETKRSGRLPTWITNDLFIHFLAGMIDSDGSIYVRKTGTYFQYMIRIFGEDKDLLANIRDHTRTLGFTPVFYCSSKAGDFRYHGDLRMIYNKDYHIVEICRKSEVKSLLKILPILHSEKIDRKNFIFDLDNKGIVLWNDAEILLTDLKNNIRNDVKESIENAKIVLKMKNTIPCKHPME